MPRLVLALACAVACAVVAGCSASGAPSATEDDTTLPLSTSGWKPGDNRFLAGFHGRVVLTAEGCVIATDGLNLVWPGTTTGSSTPSRSRVPISRHGPMLAGRRVGGAS